jgi:AcrR family transcriptional regulator
MNSQQRGRPRDRTIDARVLTAAVEELAERGIAGFSINSVAARAGADKRGIYARWPERDQLVLDALGTLAAGLVPPRTGSLRRDLSQLAPLVAAVFTRPRLDILQRCVTESRDYPAIYAGFQRDSVDRCCAVVEDAFHESRRRDEIGPTADVSSAAQAFLGMALALATLHPQRDGLSQADQDNIVSFCLAGVGAGREVLDPGPPPALPHPTQRSDQHHET